MATTATEDGDSYILNGSKIFISNGGVSEIALVWAQTDRELKHKGITCFIVERGYPRLQRRRRGEEARHTRL